MIPDRMTIPPERTRTMAGSDDEPTPRFVYLVQHGESEPKTRDAQRPLTAAGRQTVEQVAAWAAGAGLKLDQIRHSGKLRAEQIAAVLAEKLQPRQGTVSWPGLTPNDDIRPVADQLADAPPSLMIVGHLPFLSRLAGLLLVGDPDRQLVRFRHAGLMGLVREGGQWTIACVVPPELATGQ
jgi:phosphohistidine phosphatase